MKLAAESLSDAMFTAVNAQVSEVCTRSPARGGRAVRSRLSDVRGWGVSCHVVV